MTFRTRFAPSPTGPLHLGHAYSALLAFDMAQAAKGSFLLRMEDIDQSRSRDTWETQIYDDLAWLGIRWQEPVLRQSDNMNAYAHALKKLRKLGVLYHCFCNRADIRAALGAPQEGAKHVFGPDGLVYPGTCRGLRDVPSTDSTPAIRLDMAKAIKVISQQPDAAPLSFQETDGATTQVVSFAAHDLTTRIGDVVLARREMGTSYHLSVVVDDAAQEITHVVRGEDLFEATKIHVVIQRLLGLTTPVYRHHRLIRDDAGKRLAKRDDARAIAKYRQEGLSAYDIRKMVGLA